MTDIAVGIVLYESSETEVLRLVDSIRKSAQMAELPAPAVHMIDCSQPADAGLARRLEQAGVSMLAPEGNLGFGTGQNRIIREVSRKGFETYIGCNPDGFFLPSAFSAARDFFGRYGYGNLFEFRQFPQEHPKPYDPVKYETTWVAGAAFLTSVRAFEDVGGFDETFFLYCEDVDLSWRYKLSGRKCIHMPDAYFFHDISDGRQSQRVHIQSCISGRYLAWKWGSDVFRQDMEAKLLKYGLSDRVLLLPEFSGHSLFASAESVAAIVDFDCGLSFAPERW